MSKNHLKQKKSVKKQPKDSMITKAKERKTVSKPDRTNIKPNFNKTLGGEDLQFTFTPEDFIEGLSDLQSNKKASILPLNKSPSKPHSLMALAQSKKNTLLNPFQNFDSFSKFESELDFPQGVNPNKMPLNQFYQDKQKIYQSEKQIHEGQKANKFTKQKTKISKFGENSNNISRNNLKQFSYNNIQQQLTGLEQSITEKPMSPDWTTQYNKKFQNKEFQDSSNFRGSQLNEDFGQQNQNEILIDFMSNHGHSQYLGLQQVKIFDKHQNEALITEQHLKFFVDNNFVNNELIKNLLNPQILITDQNQAFKIKINNSKEQLNCSLKIELPYDFDFSAMLIWNYNAEPSIGAKECVIYYQSQLIFAGSLEKGTGTDENAKNYNLIKTKSWNLARRSTNQLLKEIFTKNRQNTPIQKYNAPHAFLNQPNQQSKIFENQFINSLTPKKLQKLSDDQYQQFKNTSLKPITQIDELNQIYDKNNKSKKSLHQQKSKKKIHSRRQSKEFENPLQRYSNILKKSQFRNLQELPSVTQLTFILLNNWGDQDYIGLNGFEFFDHKGKQILLHSSQVICPQQKQDQGFLTDIGNLVGTSFPTRDLNKHWICKRDKKQSEVKITVDFKKTVKLALIRIWNYNCSRIKAARGVKNLVLIADKKTLIFMGKIKKASGTLRKKVKNYELILFTKNVQLLRQMSVRDWMFKKLKDRDKSQRKIKETVTKNLINRPPTVDKNNQEIVNFGRFQKNQNQTFNIYKNLAEKNTNDSPDNEQHPTQIIQQIQIQVLETWGLGNSFEIGQIEFFNENQQKIPLGEITLQSECKSNVFDLSESFRQKKLIKFHKNTSLENNLKFNFTNPIHITSLKIYPVIQNSKAFLTSPKRIHLFLDSIKVSPPSGIFLTMGFNGKHLLSSQSISFPLPSEPKLSFPLQGNWISCLNLCFHLKSTFGDPYYIGLNELEIFDLQGKNLLRSSKFQIQGLPPGVIIDPEMITDQRVVSNLYTGERLSKQYKDIWLTFFAKYPIKCLNYTQNVIAIQFDSPVTIAMINIWNYLKDVKRAVKEVEIYADNKLIFSGYLYDPQINPLSTIIFSKFLQKTKNESYQLNPVTQREGGLVQLTNEGDVVFSAPQAPFEDFRPLTGQEKQLIYQIKLDLQYGK